MRKTEVDGDGFQKKYVPKGSKLAQEASIMSKQAGRRSRGNSNIGLENESKKKQAAAKKEDVVKKQSMYHIFQSLAPKEDKDNEESVSEDEDAMRLVDRKISMNQENVVGLDFERYNKTKPSPEIKLKISNLFLEFKESLDKEHAMEEFLGICDETETSRFMVAGHILNYAFSQDESNWNHLSSFVIQYLH